MKRDRLLGFGLLALSCFTLNAQANDWPQWRGPQRDGTTQVPLDPAFGKGGPDIRWQTDIGVGFSAVTVADGRLYTAGWADGKTTFYCFNADTGEKAWSHSFATNKYDRFNVGGTRGSAAVSDGRVYFVDADAGMHCYDAKSGEVLWQKDLAKAYGVKAPDWGFSGSPVILGDVVYVDVGRTVALNKADGKEIWKTDNLGPAYSSPAPFSFKGKDYLAVFPSTGLYVIERETGKVAAHHGWKTPYGVNAATPAIIGDRIFISSEYKTGCAMLRFTGDTLDLLWENRNMQNKMGTCVTLDGYLYGFNGTKFACMDIETGKTMWEERGFGHGTVIATGKTLVVLSDSGEVLTAEASPKRFVPVTRIKVIDGDSSVWTGPTLANAKLYIRGSRGKLVCLDVSR